MSDVLILTVEIGSMLLIIQGDRERLLLMGPKKLKGETTHLFLGKERNKLFHLYRIGRLSDTQRRKVGGKSGNEFSAL